MISGEMYRNCTRVRKKNAGNEETLGGGSRELLPKVSIDYSNP